MTNESFALEALHNYKGNICLVASEKDEYIPYQTTENYINAVSNKEKLVFHLMENIGHALISPVKMYQFLKILYSFFK